jgi:biopolymer transport protein ExbB/TolQ
MAVLALCSVASIAVALERFWRFRRFRSEIKSAGEKLESVIEKGGLSAGAAHAAAGTSALHDLYLSAYSKRDLAREEQLGAMELTARLYLSGLERFLGVLGTIGSTAPFIGLFGTVLGIIRAFSDLAAAEGAGGASVVADGIAEALVATAAGLFVAVPAVVAYNYFVRALGRLSVELECAAVSLVDAMAESKKRGQQ